MKRKKWMKKISRFLMYFIGGTFLTFIVGSEDIIVGSLLIGFLWGMVSLSEKDEEEDLKEGQK